MLLLFLPDNGELLKVMGPGWGKGRSDDLHTKLNPGATFGETKGEAWQVGSRLTEGLCEETAD